MYPILLVPKYANRDMLICGYVHSTYVDTNIPKNKHSGNNMGSTTSNTSNNNISNVSSGSNNNITVSTNANISQDTNTNRIKINKTKK